MSLLWSSILHLGPRQREAKHVYGELLNHCGAKLYIQCVMSLLQHTFNAMLGYLDFDSTGKFLV